MKQIYMLNEVPCTVTFNGSSLVAFSWNYYDVNHDAFHASHWIICFEHKTWGIRKTLFGFGSIAKRDKALNQLSNDMFIDFDLVDYSKRSEAKLKSRMADFKKLSPDCFSYDMMIEKMCHEPGYNVSVYHNIPNSHKDLTNEIDAYLYLGSLRDNASYNWSGFYGDMSNDRSFSQLVEGKGDALDLSQKGNEMICFLCGNTQITEFDPSVADICEKCKAALRAEYNLTE